MKKVWKVLWPWMLDVAVMVLAGWLMLGCSTKRVVQSNSRAVHDTVYVQHGVRDSVRWQTMLRDSVRLLLRDSVVVVRDTSGRTIERYEWHWADRGRDKAVSDDKARVRTDTLTVYKVRTDTAYVTRTVRAEPSRKHKSRLAVVLCVLALLVAAGVWLKLKCVK